MRYLGSKNRLAKELIPIIQSYITEDTEGYIEPFVGGANVIDKIKCKKRIGCDIHKQLIALLKHVQSHSDNIPNTISEEEYIKVKYNKQNYPDWYLGLVGFCASFGSLYFAGYGRRTKRGRIIDVYGESIKNLKKQIPNIKDVTFLNMSFESIPIEKLKNYVIYCDIPYRGTVKYSTKQFPYRKFYKWAKEASKNNIVLISEYRMPPEFECIWEGKIKTSLHKNKIVGENRSIRTERLFTYNHIDKIDKV